MEYRAFPVSPSKTCNCGEELGLGHVVIVPTHTSYEEEPGALRQRGGRGGPHAGSIGGRHLIAPAMSRRSRRA